MGRGGGVPLGLPGQSPLHRFQVEVPYTVGRGGGLGAARPEPIACHAFTHSLVRSDPVSHLAQCVRRKRLVLQQLLVCVLPRPYSQLLSAQHLDPLNLGQFGRVPLVGGQGTVRQGQCRKEEGKRQGEGREGK